MNTIWRKNMKRWAKAGFSLIELMIVVAIIGILASVAIPNFQRFQVKARQAEARANLSAIYTAEKAFMQEWSQYFADFIEIGYSPEGNFRYEHGFQQAGVNSPAGYTGVIMGGAAAMVFSTVGCGLPGAPVDLNGVASGGLCTVDRNPTAGAVAGLVTTALETTTFDAAAHGNIDTDATTDVWKINESKILTGPCSAAVAGNCVPDGGDLDM